MAQIKLMAGDDTEDLISFVANELPPELLDAMEIERIHAEDIQVASEPITVGALISLTSVAAIAVTRLLEKWIENRREREHMNLVVRAFGVSDEAGRALAELARKHADVSISYGVQKPQSGKRNADS
jgi:hypothetical protein